MVQSGISSIYIRVCISRPELEGPELETAVWGLNGSSVLTLDGKGRMNMPSRYRERLRTLCDGRMVATIAKDPCLILYPMPEWEKLSAQVESLPGMDPQVANFKRRFFGMAEDVRMDNQGRVLIPTRLRELGGLDKEVALVGVANKFEMWPADAWAAINARPLAEDLDAAGSVSESLQTLAI